MNSNDINQIRNRLKKMNPLIHCITNPISVNQCANAVLAVGARPIMAEHPDEAAEITKTAKALLLNLGNITNDRLRAISISSETACGYDIPFVLDGVGTACSTLRKKFAHNLIEKYTPDIIKGNYSEIYALYDSDYTSSGIDADISLAADNVTNAAAQLARKYNTVILASGKTDIITNGKKAVYIKNGTPRLASVTGTGCVLGALTACYLAAERDMSAAVTACAVLGICGELSESEKGNGSFMVRLSDCLSLLSDKDIHHLKMEETEFEEF